VTISTSADRHVERDTVKDPAPLTRSRLNEALNPPASNLFGPKPEMSRLGAWPSSPGVSRLEPSSMLSTATSKQNSSIPTTKIPLAYVFNWLPEGFCESGVGEQAREPVLSGLEVAVVVAGWVLETGTVGHAQLFVLVEFPICHECECWPVGRLGTLPVAYIDTCGGCGRVASTPSKNANKRTKSGTRVVSAFDVIVSCEDLKSLDDGKGNE